MKTRLIVFATTVLGLVILVTERVNASPGTPTLGNPSRFGSIEEVINTLLGLVRPIVIITLVGTLMYGGWVYLTAGADDEKVGRARRILVAAIIGFIIIVVAPAVVQLVGSFLGVDRILDTQAQ